MVRVPGEVPSSTGMCGENILHIDISMCFVALSMILLVQLQSSGGNIADVNERMVLFSLGNERMIYAS